MYDSKSLSRTLLIVLGIRRKGRESFPDSAIFKLFPRPEWSLILFKFFGCCFLFFKIDVYSFRVLLCEMCTFKQFTDSQKRLAQVNYMVRNNGLRKLVRRCLKTNPKERPDMTEIISELKRLRWNRLLGHSLFTRSVRNM